LIFSIAMGTDKLFYVKFIATYAATFSGYIISVLAIVIQVGKEVQSLFLHFLIV
jgi:cell division protein FtsL